MCTGETLKGTTLGTYHGQIDQGRIPNITGATGGCVGNVAPSGAFTQGGQYGTAGGGSGRFYQNNFDASRSSSLYQNVSKVEPYGYWMYHLIKYI